MHTRYRARHERLSLKRRNNTYYNTLYIIVAWGAFVRHKIGSNQYSLKRKTRSAFKVAIYEPSFDMTQKPWLCAMDSFLSFFQDSFLSYFSDSFLSLFSDSFLSFYFQIVFYPIFGLNSILFSDSFKKMPKIHKKDRIQSKNGIEYYSNAKRWKTIQKKGQKTIRKIGQKTILKKDRKLSIEHGQSAGVILNQNNLPLRNSFNINFQDANKVS